MRFSSKILLGALLVLAACVTPAPEIVRGDWVVVPEHHGRSEVIPRAQYAEWRSHYPHRHSSSLEQVPPKLLDVPGVIHIGVGEARTFLLLDEPVAGMRLVGGSARVFWGMPYEIDSNVGGHWVQRKGADVFIEGVSSGESELILNLRDGTSRQFAIDSH